MSEAVVAALCSSALTGAVSIVLFILTNKNSRALVNDERKATAEARREDRTEWYRRAVYERRLNATQQAYEWLSRINDALNAAKQGDRLHPGTIELLEVGKRARQWYDSNALWFHGGLPASSPFIGLCNAVGAWSAMSGQVDVWKMYADADEFVRANADMLAAEAEPRNAESAKPPM